MSDRAANDTERLLEVNLRTMPLSQCNKTHLEHYLYTSQQYVLREGISKSQFCAYDANPVKESCRTESGGPLRKYVPNSLLPNVIGIISFGLGITCNAEHPAILTRVAYYIPWIEAIVWPFDRSM